MTATELINDLRRRDVRLTADGERLRVDAPVGVLTDELRAELRRLKPELRELLQHEQESGRQDVLTAPERALLQSDRDSPGDWLDTVLTIRGNGSGKTASVTPGLSPDDLPADWRVWFEERAAIREYDGGQAREHAEAEALWETLAAMRQAGEL